MSTITTLISGENGAASVIDINNNFSNLNADKLEGPTASVDSEVALFSGTGGKTLKRATGSGFAKLISGVISLVTSIVEGDFSFTDITTANVTSSAHGLAPKAPADATKFLNGANPPAYAQVKDSDLATTDITTNDVTTSKHGFVPKAPNDTTKFLRGDGTWAILTAVKQMWINRNAASTADTIGPGSGGDIFVNGGSLEFIIPFTGNLINFIVKTGATTPNATSTFTVYVNGSSTALTMTAASGATNTVVSDTTHTVAVTAGNTLKFHWDSGAGGSNLTALSWSVELTA